MNKEEQERKSSVATLLVMVSTLITRLLGYLKFALIANYFGGAGLADVINGVFFIPNNLRKLMAEGALTTAFIPALSKQIVRHKHDKAVLLTRQVLTLQYVVLIPFIVVSIIGAPVVARLFISFDDLEKVRLAQQLYAWFIPYLLFISVAAIIMAVLNTHGRFLLAALSPLLFSIAVITSLVVFTPLFGVYSMVIGVLSGGVGQVVIQYPLFRKLGYRLWPRWHWKDEEFGLVLKRYLPALLTSSVFAINQQVAMSLAVSYGGDGGASALSYAIVFFHLPFGIFSAAVNTVFYPRLAKAAQQEDEGELLYSLKKGLHLLFVFLVPSAFFMSILSSEIVSVALLRGAFTLLAVKMTAATLVGFSVGMFFVAAYNFTQRYFYAKGHFRLPLISALFTCVLDVVLSVWLIHTNLGVSGLAYANSIAFFVGFLAILVLILKKKTSTNYRDTLILLWKVIFSLAIGYLAYWLITRWFINPLWWQLEASFSSKLLLLFLQGALPALVVLGMYILLRVEMINEIFTLMRRPKR